MKKILATVAMLASTVVFAGSATVEYQNFEGKSGSKDSQQVMLTVKEKLTTNLAGDIKMSNRWVDDTNSLSTRLELGLTGTKPINNLELYTRLGVGEKFTGSTKFEYYSVEPGIKAKLGNTGLQASLGYRYQTPFDSSINDTTRTWRTGLAYNLSRIDAVGIRYDRARGDSNNDGVALFYTRGF